MRKAKQAAAASQRKQQQPTPYQQQQQALTEAVEGSNSLRGQGGTQYSHRGRGHGGGRGYANDQPHSGQYR